MLKLNIGFSKKIGEAHYGSRGAGVNLEVELEAAVIGESERLKERIRHLFTLAKAAVDEELAAGGNASAPATPPTGADDEYGRTENLGRRRDGTRPATASQVRALHAIADRRGLDLSGMLTERFRLHDPAGLTITEASTLIDELKTDGVAGGNGGRR